MSPLTRSMEGGFVGTPSELENETGNGGTGSDFKSNRRRDHLDAGGRDHRGKAPNDETMAGAIRRGHGYDGLFDRRRQRPSPKRVPMETVEQVLRLYREVYSDFNVSHFVDKLHEEHQIELSYSWVKKALQEGGLVARKRKRGRHYKQRPHRPLPGMLLHVDGSRHEWLSGQGYQHLIAILDDATSQVYYARLVDQESTATVMAALKETVEKQRVTGDRPCVDLLFQRLPVG